MKEITEKDLEKCAYWYQKAAEQGESVAQNNLGLCYEYGKGVISDSEQAVLWYRKSAENRNSNAQYNLGRCYENGYGVIKDIPEALKWYQKAADQGHENAKSKLEQLNRREASIGTKSDMDETIAKMEEEWQKKTLKDAMDGDAQSQYLVADWYESGFGTSVDMSLAVY